MRKITPGGTVTTLAGAPGQSGSTDGVGSAARFLGVYGIAVDTAGNLYVADTFNSTIRKVTPTGTVTTLAGSAGITGSNDGTGSSALFNQPQGVAVDGAGNVYVADTINQTIRKITPAGVVTTLAGSPGITGSADGTGSAARFLYAQSLALDSANNLYIADSGNNTIRKLTPGGVVTTLAGAAGTNGSADGTGSVALFVYPQGVAVDSAGNVFVADSGNDTIRKITPGGTVTTLAGQPGNLNYGDGIGSAARFGVPQGLAAHPAGKIYVADSNNDRIRVLEPLCPAGNLDPTFNPGPYSNPAIVAVAIQPSGKILIGGTFTNYNGNGAANGIARLDASGTLDSSFNPGGGGADGVVRSITLQADGKILIGGGFSHYNGQQRNGVARLDANGVLDSTFLPGTGQNALVSAIRLQSTGEILVGGFFISGSNPRIARLQGATGAVDTTFNSGTGADGTVESISVQSDDKIIIGGDFTHYNGVARGRLARLNSDGTLDGGFIPPAGADNLVFVTTLEPGMPPNKVIIGGEFLHYDGMPRYGVARVLPSGALDTIFDANSVTTANPLSAVQAVSVLADGNILIAGTGFSNSGAKIARLFPTGALDTSFDPAPGTGADDVILDVAIQHDGKVLIGGEFTSYSGVSLNCVARLCGNTAPAPAMRLANISTRAAIGTGNAVTIAGFIVTGSAPVKIIARAIGPTLTISNVSGALQDPVLELYTGSTLLGLNDNWGDTPQNLAAVQATGIPPLDSRESALVQTLNPGAYTAIMRGANGTTGAGLIEVYDLTQPLGSELANISTRGNVQVQGQVMIGGFILGGSGITNVIVRALGPSLAQFNIGNILIDPTLELFNSQGTSLGFNDNWGNDPNAAQAIANGLAPTDPLESSIAVTLAPGAYTAIAAGHAGGTGIGLVEVYHVH